MRKAIAHHRISLARGERIERGGLVVDQEHELHCRSSRRLAVTIFEIGPGRPRGIVVAPPGGVQTCAPRDSLFAPPLAIIRPMQDFYDIDSLLSEEEIAV